MAGGSMQAAHGWLPLVVPADARRFRVADASLANALTDAGAHLAADRPEVEIVYAPGDLRGGAELGIVAIAGPESRGGHAAVRAARRAVHSLRGKALAARARRGLRSKGYSDVAVVYWDLQDRVAVPGLTRHGPRLPRYALAVGSRGPARPPAVVAAVEAALEPPRDVDWASARAGLIVLAVDGNLMRVAIGPTRTEIDHAFAALHALAAAAPPPEVADRVPWPVGRGREGLADWSVERLVAGARPDRALSPQLFDDCLAFLIALGGLRNGDGESLSEHAATISEVCEAQTAERARLLAGRLDDRLAGVQRCFAHGDFFPGNLLESDGRLTGVVDWDAAGPGRLPLVDLLHLQLTRSGPFADADWGRLVLERLLPLARAGGDDVIRRYCREVGLSPQPRVLEGLVFAYWLQYAAYQLRSHPVRRVQPAWIAGNVELVLRSAPEALAD